MAKPKVPPKNGAKPAPPLKANRATMACGPAGGEKSVEIRKISNGFVVRESSWNGKGQYKSKETFSAKAPTVQLAPGKGK